MEITYNVAEFCLPFYVIVNQISVFHIREPAFQKICPYIECTVMTFKLHFKIKFSVDYFMYTGCVSEIIANFQEREYVHIGNEKSQINPESKRLSLNGKDDTRNKERRLTRLVNIFIILRTEKKILSHYLWE